MDDELFRTVRYAQVDAPMQVSTDEAIGIHTACHVAAERVAGVGLHDDRLIYAAECLASALPQRLRERLCDLRDYGSVDGVLLVDGLPTDEPSATPRGLDEEPPWTALPVATLTQLAIMTVLGAPISYADEKSGKLIQEVYPKRGHENEQENSGSSLLELHTEDGFLMTPPDFLSLFCIRTDHELRAATVACGIRRIVEILPEEVMATLREPRFRISFSSSFVTDDVSRWTEPLPVLTGPTDDPDMCVDLHGMQALDARAERAITFLRDCLETHLVGGVLRPGSLLIVDNNAAVHGRTSFTPRHDGTDRWLRRCYVTRNLRRSRSDILYGRMLRSRERVEMAGSACRCAEPAT